MQKKAPSVALPSPYFRLTYHFCLQFAFIPNTNIGVPIHFDTPKYSLKVREVDGPS